MTSAMNIAASVAAVAILTLGLAGCGGGDGGSGAPGGTEAETTETGTGEQAAPSGPPAELVIYSPHSDAIKTEFERGFRVWYRDRTGRDVTFSWPDAGGSSGILPHVQDKAARGIHDVDIVFGGGPIHSRMVQLGLLMPCKLPQEVLDLIPETIAGVRVYDAEYRWYGAAVSSFGLIVNTRVIGDRNLPQVTEWTDMARPEFFGLVGAADASQSGSVRKAYEIMLQAYGYDAGMKLLALTAANARDIARSASDIPRGCEAGLVAVGPCIDFYAWRQMRGDGGDFLDFVLPEGLTVVNPDPIGILAGAPHPDVARAFVEFVMSPDGQKLWCLEVGAPGGPVEEPLGRTCVLPSVYKENAEHVLPGVEDPIHAKANTEYDLEKEEARLAILPAYLQAMMVTNKRQLTDAWSAVIAAGMPEDLVAELTAPVVSEAEMLRLARDVWIIDPDMTAAQADKRRKQQSDLKLQWSNAFRDRYETVKHKARQRAE